MTDQKANTKWITAKTARKKALASKESARIKFLESVYSEINLACEMSKTYVTWRQIDHPMINFATFVTQVVEILQKKGYSVCHRLGTNPGYNDELSISWGDSYAIN